MAINAEYLNRCIEALEGAHSGMQKADPEGVMHNIFRAACVKEYELVLEQTGKLLKKRLREFFASNQALDKIYFNDIFRHAAKHGLIDIEACERWLQYRENRNNTAHDYGETFAENTLRLLPQFIDDAKRVAKILQQKDDG